VNPLATFIYTLLTLQAVKKTHNRKFHIILVSAAFIGIVTFSQGAESRDASQGDSTVLAANRFMLSIPNGIGYVYYTNPVKHTQIIAILVPYVKLNLGPLVPPGHGGNLLALTLRPEEEARAKLSNYDSQIAQQSPEVWGEWDIYKVGSGTIDLYVNRTGERPQFFTCPPGAKDPKYPVLCETRQILDRIYAGGNLTGVDTTLIYGFTPGEISHLSEINQHVLDFVNSLIVKQ